MATKYLDTSGLQYLWSKIKTWAKRVLVSSVTYDGNTKAIKMTKYDGTNDTENTTQIVTAATIVADGGGITSHQDISGKADKVSGATAGNVATLNSSGNLVDSGKTLGVSVPSGAVFTDTTDTAGALQTIAVNTKHYIIGSTKQGDSQKTVTDSNVYFKDGILYSHDAAVVNVSSTQTLSNKTLASPTLTGTPVAPTATSGTNTTQIATTAFVQGELDDYVQKSNTTGLLKNDGTVDTNTYLTSADVSGKADKVTGAVSGNFASLDSNGNLTDSGHKHSDYLTSHQDISGKADKVSGATAGNLAALNSSGNIKDIGYKITDLVLKVDNPYDKLTSHPSINGTILNDGENDSSKFNLPIVTYTAQSSFLTNDLLYGYFDNEGVWIDNNKAESFFYELTESVVGVIITADSNNHSEFAFTKDKPVFGERYVLDGSLERLNELAEGRTEYMSVPGGAHYLYVLSDLSEDPLDHYLPSIEFQVLKTTSKMDKVGNSTEDHVATFNGSGNVKDSGKTLGVSVPSNALFTDTKDTTGVGDIGITAFQASAYDRESIGLIHEHLQDATISGEFVIPFTKINTNGYPYGATGVTNTSQLLKTKFTFDESDPTDLSRAAAQLYIGGQVVATNSNILTLSNKTLASPTLTGTPVAPTAVAGTNTTQIATTAFVNTAITSASGNYVSASVVGRPSGVCPLDANTKIDSQYLPSYVDDIIEAYARSGQTALSSTWLATGSASGTVITPESGKIYVLMADTTDYSANTQFRWSGTTYVKLNDGGVSAITNAEIDSITNN